MQRRADRSVEVSAHNRPAQVMSLLAVLLPLPD
jgi:hypothetical protein